MNGNDYRIKKRDKEGPLDQQKEHEWLQGVFEQRKQDQFGTQAETESEIRALDIRKKIVPKLVMVGYFGSVLTLNTFTYKRLVKMVKGRFSLMGFWPIHFAIFPFMCAINFSVFGIGEGLAGVFLFEKMIKDSSRKIIRG